MTEERHLIPHDQEPSPSYTAPVDPADDEGFVSLRPEDEPDRDAEQLVEDLEQTKNRH